MSQIEKLYKKFFAKPESIKYRELERILLHLDFIRAESKGSHVKFKHHKLMSDILIPVHNNDCKEFYKKQAKKQISNLNK